MKWSSWSLINESHLPACVCVHRSPPPNSVTRDGPCRTTPSTAGVSGQGRGFCLCGWLVTTVQKTKLRWDVHTAASALRELHPPSPSSAMSRSKVQRHATGETWSDPFGASAPWRCNTLVLTKLKQWFYERDKKIQFRFTDCVKSLSWWKGPVPAACRLPELTLSSREQRGEGGWTNPGTRPPVFGNA